MKNVLTFVFVFSWLLTSLPVAAQDEFSSTACTSKFQGAPYKQPVTIRRLSVKVTYDRKSVWRPSRRVLIALVRESIPEELKLQLVGNRSKKTGTAHLEIRYCVWRDERWFASLDCDLSRLDGSLGRTGWKDVAALQKPEDMRALLKKTLYRCAKLAKSENLWF